MEKISLDIIGMSYSQSQSGAYALILGERNGRRRLPIIIGGFEAQAIAIELEKIRTPRPLTHDLFKSFANAYQIEVTEVIINKFSEGVFYAQLKCSDGQIDREIDSRTSDAIALALRFNCPVYTYENILSSAGILMDEDSDVTKPDENHEIPSDPEQTSLSHTSTSDLKDALWNAIENEEYEKASKIRDELKKRK
ncbi:MAG: bifunctional nuclease domain-containing protein [Bacteroidota bacterium]